MGIRRTRKITAMIMAGIMIMSNIMIGIPRRIPKVHAEGGSFTDDEHGIIFTYEDLADGGVIVNRIEPSDSSVADGSLDLVIPETIDGKAVKKLAAGVSNGVSNKRKFKTVSFNSSIEEIPYQWGRGFQYVTSVSFPENSRCSEIADDAFYGCDNLETVVFPDGLEYVGSSVFVNCPKLGSVDLGSSLLTIGEAAFQGTAVTDVTFPDSLTSIGDEAFNYCPKLRSITFGSGLTDIGERAFSSCSLLSSIDLPSSLNNIGADAFKNCGSLSSVTWPQDNPDFKTIRGFEGCSALPDDVLTDIPSSVTTIGDRAFYKCSFETVTIPWNIGYIGKQAFAENQNSSLSDIVIDAGLIPLTIDEKAFYYAPAMDSKEIILPERVSEIRDEAFNFVYKNSDVFTIYNKSIVISGDPWNDLRFATIKYPSDMTEATSPSFMNYKEDRESVPRDYPFTFTTFETEVYHTVYGTVPSGASVTAMVSGKKLTPEISGNSFSFKALEGSLIMVTISLEGYKDLALGKSSSEFTEDWNLGEVTLGELTPVEQIGGLSIVSSGEGSAGANITIFDSANRAVASGSTDSSGVYLVQELPAGTYTVVAFEKNAYISGVSSLESLSGLGIDSSSYLRKTAEVTGGNITEISINVPLMPHSDYSSVLDEMGTFVTIDRSLVTRNMDFYAKVFYRMKGSNSASKIQIYVPEGMNVTSVTSKNKAYSTGSVYSDGVITIDGLSGTAASTGTIYVGLKSTETGCFTVSASVEASSGITIPVGSVDIDVEELKLELKERTVSSRTVPITVWAEPGKQVKIRAGKAEERVFGTTNKLGIISGNVELPEDTVPGTSQLIIASVDGLSGKITDMDTVYYEKTDIDLNEFYFIHANHRYNLVENSVNKSGGFYTYVADGKEATKNWTFGTTLISTSALTGNVTVGVQMMDGSIRNVVLTSIKTEALPGGRIKTHFAANIYIESAGYHEFDDSLVPEGFDVDYTAEDDQALATDEAYTEYLESAVEAILEERRKNLPPDPEPAWTEEDITIYITDFLFGAYYTHVREIIDNMRDEFDSLSPSDQAVVMESDQAMGDLLDAWSMAVGDVEPMRSYDNFDDYVRDNWWDYEVYEGDSFRAPEDFTDDGYILSDDGSFAYTDDGRNLVRLNEDGTRTEEIRMIKDVEGMSNDEKDAYWTYFKQTLSAADAYGNYLSDLDKLGKLGPKMKTFSKYYGRTVAIFGLAANAYDTAQASEDYVEGVEKTCEYKLLYTDIQNERRLAERMGRDRMSSECLKAIRAEEMAAYELVRAGERRDTVVENTIYIGAFVTLFTGAMIVAAPPVGASLAISIGGLTGAIDYLGMNQTILSNNDVYAASVAYDRAHIKRKYSCADEETRAKYRLKAIFDPSGFVYEAVESNVVEGVEAVLADSGTEETWNAAEYDQINPQITDPEGRFAWDVPMGTWKVRFTKDGYKDYITDELVVPPPRMDLRIPLVTERAPEIESVNAYTDYIEIIFDQYMKIDDVSEIMAKISGEQAAVFEWQDVEESPSGERYSRAVHIPVSKSLSVGDTVDITIGDALNYAGIPMSALYETTAAVSHRPTEIILNYENLIIMKADSDKNITVRIRDENGNYMEGVTVTAMIDNPYLAEIGSSGVTDEEGKTVIPAKGLLPGMTDAVFKVDGTTLSRTVSVEISTEPVQAKRPVAVIGDVEFGEGSPKENYITVDEGAVLILQTATEGAEIYYTTDDTCPCQNNSSRNVYTGPVTITKDVRIRIAAYRDGLEYSDRLNLNITVREKPKYILKFDLAGGIMDGKSGEFEIVCREGDHITIPDAPVREGYIFEYWQGSEYYPGDSYLVTENHKFTAVWKQKDTDKDQDETGDGTADETGDPSDDNSDVDGAAGDGTDVDGSSEEGDRDNGKSGASYEEDGGREADVVTTEAGDSNRVPDTGDRIDPMLWMIIGVFSLFCAVTLHMKAVKYEEE